METKKAESQIDAFAKAVDSLSGDLLGENNGYILFAYGALGKGLQENTFSVRGKLNAIAESLYSFMKQNPALANVIIAATNAYAQHQVLETAMAAEPKSDKKQHIN